MWRWECPLFFFPFRAAPSRVEMKRGETFRLGVPGAHGFLFCCFLCVIPSLPAPPFLSYKRCTPRTSVLGTVRTTKVKSAPLPVFSIIRRMEMERCHAAFHRLPSHHQSGWHWGDGNEHCQAAQGHLSGFPLCCRGSVLKLPLCALEGGPGDYSELSTTMVEALGVLRRNSEMEPFYSGLGMGYGWQDL